MNQQEILIEIKALRTKLIFNQIGILSIFVYLVNTYGFTEACSIFPILICVDVCEYIWKKYVN